MLPSSSSPLTMPLSLTPRCRSSLQLRNSSIATTGLIDYYGRRQVGHTAYLLTRFADSDTWTVEFYNENPGSGNGVGVVPLRRSNDTLKGLGLANGTKLDFPVNLVLALAADGTHFGYIDLAGSPSDVQGVATLWVWR